MKPQLISGCAVTATALVALSGCTKSPPSEAVPGERHTAGDVIEIGVGSDFQGWTSDGPDDTALACAVFRSGRADEFGSYGLAGIMYERAMTGSDAGVRNAARALSAATTAGTVGPDLAKIESAMRTACYAHDLYSTALTGWAGHSYVSR